MMRHYEQLVEQAPDGMVIHDGYRIVAVNAATLRLAGATHRGQLIGQLVSTLFERPYLKWVERVLCAPTAGVEVPPFVRERLHGVDGEVRSVDISAQLFLYEGRPTAHLVLHDAWAHEQAEQEAAQHREQARYTERAAEARSVAGGIAHLLNNKLQIILGFGGELLASSASDDQRADIAEINRAAQECAHVTRQLLQIASDAPFHARPVELHTAAQHIVRELQGALTRSGGSVHCTGERVPEVQMDEEHLRQMLGNLLDNAHHAADGHGRMDVAVRPVRLDVAQLACDGRRMDVGVYATLTVRDTGRGMDHEVQRHMLEPFFTTDLVGHAAGLGLSAVLGMARQNDGFLTFTTTVGQGSAFTLWFASGGQTGARLSTSVWSASQRLASTIVVVDEQAASRAIAVRGLERVGYRVLVTRSAEEATEVMAHIGCPALMVMGASIPVRYPRLRRVLHAQWPQLRTLVLAGTTATVVPQDATWFTLDTPLSEYAVVSRVQELLGVPDASGR